jgi:signal recognition particle receptor subunit beta
MVLFNYATRELTAKIVYYGPGLCGKTTNLEHIHRSLPANKKSKMLSLATKTDRTLFFDFLPIELGAIRGMKTKIQLYTVPGQVFYDATRKLVLKGADGVVFVADSQKAMMDSNVDSWQNFETNLKENGLDIHTIPLVIQYNKRDLPDVLPVKDLNKKLNARKAPFYEASAINGQGVQDTLKGITKLVLEALSKRHRPSKKREVLEEVQEVIKQSQQPTEPEQPAVSPTLPTVEELIQEFPGQELEPIDTRMTIEPVPEVSAEEYEELEEISEVSSAPLIPSNVDLSAPTQNVDVKIPEVPDVIQIQSDQPKPLEAVVVAQSLIPNGQTDSIHIPVEIRVGPPGEEVRLQIAIELKIKRLP